MQQAAFCSGLCTVRDWSTSKTEAHAAKLDFNILGVFQAAQSPEVKNVFCPSQHKACLAWQFLTISVFRPFILTSLSALGLRLDQGKL